MVQKNKNTEFFIASAQDANKIGYSFTKKNSGGNKLSSKAYRLCEEEQTLELADALSVLKSLESLKPNFTATIYTTNPMIAKSLENKHELYETLHKVQEKRPLRRAWKKIEAQIRRQKEIKVILVDHGSSMALTEAQRQAVIGTKLSFKRTTENIKRHSKHEKNEIEQEISEYNVL